MDQSQLIKDFLREELLLFDEYLLDSVKSDNPHITEMVNYLFRSKGKRLRPILVLLTAKACGGIIPETYHGAVTVELLHSATLIHDDVIDKSELRRGRRSVNAVYDNTQAVLIGDYLLSTALMESVKTSDLNIVRIISELGQNLSEGELNQFSLASDIIIDEKAYFDVIDKKTASLMRASIVIGAITGGADSKMISKFMRLGSILGICFQIRDDIFDYFSNNVGKPTGNDIREGKITLPLIYALRNAPHELSQVMMQIIEARDYSEENIAILLDFAKEYHGVKYAYSKMNEYLAEAETIISDFRFNDEIKTLMNLFLSYLKERKY
ncbi:MAG: polyprenyl synthetase family protein [Proteiniphilum sp.]|nr:polyprenyl synthetase family protein [Proteiniphilum sp.]